MHSWLLWVGLWCVNELGDNLNFQILIYFGGEEIRLKKISSYILATADRENIAIAKKVG